MIINAEVDLQVFDGQPCDYPSNVSPVEKNPENSRIRELMEKGQVT